MRIQIGKFKSEENRHDDFNKEFIRALWRKTRVFDQSREVKKKNIEFLS
jgi:hypothetical protein